MSKRVLVVSSSSVTRALLGSLLPSDGYEMLLADSLPAALETARRHPPRAIILEAGIVRASEDTVQRLREAAGGEAGVVLASRSYADERRGAAEQQAFGAQAWVAIPPDGSALEEALRAAAGDSMLPPQSPEDVVPAPAQDSIRVLDADQAARYAERLHAKLEELDAYQLLRVSPTATQPEIEAAFRRRALEFHPDRPQPFTDEETRERTYQIFKKISWAFRKVGDAASRREYDSGRQAAK
ncbi:MAG: DnaJ domain-containing protein [Deltaproteobacteria bacterium]|nr:DnaJ domain-containing protein [Deltaproteobacteria bacterium]